MPIKLPKGFPRRKSSGNVLDEAQSPAEPSFKVYSRPNSSGQILDTNASEKRLPLVHQHSFEQEDDDLFTVARADAANRGSRTTEKSLSTAQYDSGASSTRLSTSSTNPSSIETKSDKIVQSPKEQQYNDIPTPPAHQRSGFLRNAGRTFSFGLKAQKSNPEPELPSPPTTARNQVPFWSGRDGSTTASTMTATTPPRLLDSDLALDESELDGFGNMFDGIGVKSNSPARSSPMQKPLQYNGRPPYPDSTSAPRVVPPRSLYIDSLAPVESSPYSNNSETSRDGLMRSPSPSKTVTQNSPQTAIPGNMFVSSADTTSQEIEDKMDGNMFVDNPGRPRAYSKLRHTGPSIPSYATGGRLPNPPQSPIRTIVPMVPTSPSDQASVFDENLLASAELASKYQATKPPPPVNEPTKKIMTPQQFERYKQLETERQRMNKAFGKTDSDESGDDYEDEGEDESERDRQASKQRRKQEAHLAVYRQTMIKVTGEQAGPSTRAVSNFGAPSDMTNRMSSINLASKSPSNLTDEDEDEDVPLGILAAHGFPNKNKPPSRTTASGSNLNLPGSVHSQLGPGSVAGESSVQRTSLPAFARKLPEDPYYGAGLVNQSNRESLALHSNPGLLSPSGGHTNHPHHPAGLVGVIAGEERARAARRGSPNATTGQYDSPSSMPDHPGMVRAQTMGQMPMMMPGMPGMPLSPGDQAQIQMSQQMNQMMQMQMQWMQQMQQYMGNRPPSAMPMMPGMPGVSGMPMVDPLTMGLVRPQSVPLQNSHEPAPRSMSTLSPAMAGWNHPSHLKNGRPGSSYAASMAPSERSNIGLASRYRPVSTLPESNPQDIAWQKRASTMQSGMNQWSAGTTVKQPGPQTIRQVTTAIDDDDDEAGWAEMKAKKDKKQKSWKLRKGSNPLQELYNGPT